jgi:hypothetical protein
MHQLILRIIFVAILLCLQGTLSQSAKAAGPISHLYYAQYWLKVQHPEVLDNEKSLFLKGTLFPDIRYLGVIHRAETHKKHVTLSHVQKLFKTDPFGAGMLFHSYLDEERAKFVEAYKISRHLRTIPKNVRDTFLKFLEDELLAEKTKVIDTLFDLNTVDPKELTFGIEFHDVKRWHRYLQLYLAQSPEKALSAATMLNKPLFGISPDTLDKLVQQISIKKEQHVFQKYGEALQLKIQKKLSHKR